MAVRVAIIGHVVPAPARIDLPRGDDEIRSLLGEFTYSRVITSDGALVDHLTFLRQSFGMSSTAPFSVWDLNLVSETRLSTASRTTE